MFAHIFYRKQPLSAFSFHDNHTKNSAIIREYLPKIYGLYIEKESKWLVLIVEKVFLWLQNCIQSELSQCLLSGLLIIDKWIVK